MWIWGKHEEENAAADGILQTAAAGANHERILRNAIAHLLSTGLDRAGIWIDAEEPLISQTSHGRSTGASRLGFRGIVLDATGDPTPAEWATLSPTDALPSDLLVAGKTIEQDGNGGDARPMIGALLEMQRAIWIPIRTGERLRGIILGGLRRKNGTFPQIAMESAAAELSLVLEMEDERFTARQRQADVSVVREILSALDHNRPPDALLAELAHNCTDVTFPGASAVFVAIGHTDEPPEPASGFGDAPKNAAAKLSQIQFSWRSGSDVWTRAVESEPIAAVWKQALVTRHVAGSEADGAWSRGEFARVIAIPLLSAGEILGVLVAGLPANSTTLSALDRLELRAGLAALALARRNQQQKSARHRAAQQALLDCSSEPMLLLGPRGEITAFSRSAVEWLCQSEVRGTEPKERPKYFSELFRARDHERIESWLRRWSSAGVATATFQDGVFQAELLSGRGVRLRGSLIANGQVAAVLELQPVSSTVIPVRAETELYNLIEWLEEGVVLFDARGGIRAMNTRFAQIAGLDPEDCGRLKTLAELIERVANQTTEPKAFAARWLEIARGTDNHTREEFQLMRPVPRVLERTARPILDFSGQRLGHLEIYRDLTAQRVFHSKLLHTEKLAALGQLITGVAHELSNPLTSVLGYAQRLLLRQDKTGRSEEVRQIVQEAERASAILRQLLTAARDTRQERRKVALNQIVSHAMELQRFSLAAEKIRIETNLDPALPFVRGDAGQLQQVVMNLIGNARQAIEQQGQGGTIRLLTKSLDGGRALLAVKDDGPGIPETILSRIFDPFFTTKPPGVGTGLGLSIVRGIVREHGGTVTVSTTPGGGATFSLEFPAVQAADLSAPLRSHPTERRMDLQPPTKSLREWKNARVLIVEDEPTVARLIADVLEDEGLHVDVHTHAKAAIDFAAKENPDLVICDVKLPGLSGRDVYESLTRDRSSLRERFLFVTGDVLGAQTREFLERNALPHLAKPFRVEELIGQVHRVLLNAAAAKPISAAAAGTNTTGK